MVTTTPSHGDGSQTYEKCARCDHFIEDNPAAPAVGPRSLTLATHLHLDNGEVEYDHDATPSQEVRALDEWKRRRPDLFAADADGRKQVQSAQPSRAWSSDRCVTRHQHGIDLPTVEVCAPDHHHP